MNSGSINDIIKNIREYRNVKKQNEIISTYGNRGENNIKNSKRTLSVRKDYGRSYIFGKAASKDDYNERYRSSIKGQPCPYHSTPLVSHPATQKFKLGISEKISINSHKALDYQHGATQILIDHSKNLYNSIREGIIAGDYLHERDTKSSDKTITKGTLRSNDPNCWIVDNIPALVKLEGVLNKQKNLSIEDMHCYFVLFHQKCKLMLRTKEEKVEDKFDGNIIAIDESDSSSDEN